MGSELKVKARFKGTTRRFDILSTITWNALSAKLSDLFSLGRDFRLKYCDDENELVLISSQEELDEALKICQRKSALLNLFIEDSSGSQQNHNQGKTKGMDSCYAEAASAFASEFSAMNARLQSKIEEEAKRSNKAAVSMHDEQESPRSEASVVSKQDEIVLTGYTDFAKVMAQSKQQEQEESNQQNENEKKTSRGWFEDQRQQRPPNHVHGKNKKSKRKKKNCYSELASAMAPQLASIQVREPQVQTSDAVAIEIDETGTGEPTPTVSVFDSATEISGGQLNSPADFNQQQMIQKGQQREIKRPRRPKRHGKKKSCYAQAALDIAPLYHAMNDRLKEQQQQQQQISQEMVSLNKDSGGEDPTPEDSPSTESESFVFVNSSDGEPSLSPTSMETGQTDLEVDYEPRVSFSGDIEENSPMNQSSQAPEQQMDSEERKDLNVVVKEVLNSSMDFIVEQTVQRVQQMTLNPSRQVPSDEASSSTDVDETTKVLHKGIMCENCEIEIQGIRYKCCNCQDYDLCEICESKPGVHEMDHVFVKLRFPAPGIGRRHGEMVPVFKSSVYKKSHDKKLRKAAKNAAKEEKRAAVKHLKQCLKAEEKERKREEKHLKKQRQEWKKTKQQQPADPRAQKMARVYEKLEMEYVGDATFPDGSVVSPGQKFLKTWVIQNTGTIAWNQWIKLECIEGGIMVTPGKSQAYVPHLEPGMQGEVSVEFIAPDLAGFYSSKWHLTYGLHTFGPEVWCEIEVATPSNADKEKPVQYDQTTLVNSAFDNDTPAPNAALVEDTKLEAASYLIVDDGSGSEYHSSEEIPERQQDKELITVSDVPLSSMEVQQRQDLEWDAGCVHDVEVVDVSADDEELFNVINFPGTEDIARSNNSEDSDDEEDSDSSLDEFTVLIPPCFNPDVPLSADPMPVKVECPKRKNSFNSKLLSRSFESYLNLDDENEPSSLPTMSSSGQVASFEKLARNNDEPTKVQSTPVLAPDADADQGEETPSGRISPIDHSVQRSTQTQTPVLRQPNNTQGETVPPVSHPLTIADRTHSDSYDGRIGNGGSPIPTNVVSDVLSSAIDAVAHVGRAAFATVDNLFSSDVQASATYKPEEDCEVTVDKRSKTTSFDAPPPPLVSRAPGNDSMRRLIEMGFADRRLNGQLLRKHNNDIAAAIDELLTHTENEWSSQRH